MIEEIEAQPKPVLAISATERADRFAVLDAEILALELEEVACIEASEVDGPLLQRKPMATRAQCSASSLSIGKPEPKLGRVIGEAT